jgi:ribosomal protein L11 methyltransferase
VTRRYVLAGADHAAALDRVLGSDAAVGGVWEQPHAVDVWIEFGDLPDLADLDVTVEEVPDDPKTWTGFEEDTFVRVADDLVVRPPWVEPPAGFVGDDLVVPRGMAFGSGEHGSTRAALLVLRQLLSGDRGPAPCASAFDVGTGSGILALYASRRGVASIAGCDVEPESVEAAQELLPGADVFGGGPEGFAPRTADLVIANLDARQLGAALEAIVACWNGSFALVLSGMRPREVDGVISRLPWPPDLRVEDGDYVSVAFRGPRSDLGVKTS